MAKATYTPEQKAEAIRIAQESTAVEAERVTGIKATTIRSWLSRGASVATHQQEPLQRCNAPPATPDDVSWLDMEAEYVTDVRRKPVTLQGIAEKYGVPVQTVKEYAARNGWTDKRDQHRTRVLQQTTEKAADIISDDIAQTIARHLKLSTVALDLVAKALADPREFYRYVEKLKCDDMNERIVMEEKEALNTTRLMQAVGILEKVQKLQRQTLGVLDIKDQLKVEVELLKLKPEEEEETEDSGFIDALKGVEVDWNE